MFIMYNKLRTTWKLQFLTGLKSTFFFSLRVLHRKADTITLRHYLVQTECLYEYKNYFILSGGIISQSGGYFSVSVYETNSDSSFKRNLNFA